MRRITQILLVFGFLTVFVGNSVPVQAAQPTSAAPAATCGCEGRNGTELGLTTLKIWQDSCRTKKLAQILDAGGSAAKIVGFLAEIEGYAWGLDSTSVAKKLKAWSATVRSANAQNQGIQIKIAIKLTGIKVTVDPQLPYADIFGFVENPTPNATIVRPVPVTGWVRVKGSCVSAITILVDGGSRGTAQYGLSRPDAGGDYGFAFNWPARTLGNHVVQVQVTTTNGVTKILPAVNSSVTSIPVRVIDIEGYVESPTSNATLPRPVQVSGWVKFDGNAISQIEILIDGGSRGFAQYGQARPDAGGNYGFTFSWPARTAGPHVLQVKVTGQNGYTRLLPAVNTAGLTDIPVTILP